MLNFELKITSSGLDNLKTIFSLFPQNNLIVGYSLEGKGMYLHRTLDNCTPVMYPMHLPEWADIVYKWVTRDILEDRRQEGIYIGHGYHIDTNCSHFDPNKVLLIYPVEIIFSRPKD